MEAAEAAERERKRQLGEDPTTAAEIREQLLRDPDPGVRAAAAQRASPAQLRVLAVDSRAEVRSVVGANANTPPDVLSMLTGDRSVHVRWWVVAGALSQRNKVVLRRLRKDNDPDVASTAAGALDDMRLYRRILNAPGERAVERIHRHLKNHLRD
jgi:hypothetical protein